jgi:hypothetical protein
MKKIFIFLGITLAGVAFAAPALAQISATANCFVTMVSPVGIAKITDMYFGNVAPDPGGGIGTVVLTPGGNRSVTGLVSLPVSTGTVSAASFTVTGSGSATYTITLPSSVTVTSSTNSMTVDAFTSSPSGTGTLTAGSQTLNVGATLHVGALQTPGAYTSATPFTVTVDYN